MLQDNNEFVIPTAGIKLIKIYRISFYVNEKYDFSFEERFAYQQAMQACKNVAAAYSTSYHQIENGYEDDYDKRKWIIEEIDRVNINEISNKITRKLIEAGFENVCNAADCDNWLQMLFVFKSEDSIEKIKEKVTYLLELKSEHIKKAHHFYKQPEGDILLTITYTQSLKTPITDEDRLLNKLNKQNLSQPYDRHAERFIKTLKHYYDISMSLEQYDELCQTPPQKFDIKMIYRINGAVMVASMLLQNKKVYVIFGQKTDRNLPNYKTALPDIFHKKTLLPVPDKVLMSGIDKIAFNKEVRATLIEKRQLYQKLFNDLKNKSDKELFLSSDLSQAEKIFVKKIRNNQEYSLTDAIKDTIEKHSGTRQFSGSTSSEDSAAAQS